MYFFIICIIIILAIIFIIYNNIILKRNKLLKAYSSLDVMLKKRYDLIPNIVETVKGYAKYEKEILSKITQLRTGQINNLEDMIKQDVEYKNILDEINILVENYPDLKASENFIHLQKVLNETEEQISAARRTYNAHVEKYNSYISFVPINLIAKLFNFKEYDFYEIDEQERENINVGERL